MSKNISEDLDNAFFKKLRKLMNIINKIHDSGFKENIKFPRICSLGNQSSGKSSVIESILGLNIIPRGDGIVTRRPIELNLHHINSGEPYATFNERKGMKFTNFKQIEETIETLTDEVCREGRMDGNIFDKPIIMNVYSQTCPDLTFVDLPGVKRIPIGYCPKNIEEIQNIIAQRYIYDPLTIILCVIPANTDIYTSESLRMAKEIDTNGTRTIGVLTKLDIMDAGTDARKILLNEEIPLKLGYIGVINKSKQIRINNLSNAEAIKKEKEFIKSHPAYKDLPQELLGTNSLINKLIEIYFRMIKENNPGIVKAINEKIKADEEELADLSELMNVMQINNCDENIVNIQDNKDKDETKKSNEKEEINLTNQEKPKDPPSKPQATGDNKKKTYGNLFG